MEISAEMEMLAIALTFFVHLLGAGVLVWALIDRDGEDAGSWRDWWPKDGPDAGPEPDPVGPGGNTAAPPLPDAQPSPVRLREPGRISERRTPARRPEHAPRPARERDPV